MAIVRELVTLLRFQNRGLQEAESGMARLTGLARGLAASLAGIGVAFSIKGLAEAGDQMTADLNKLQSALGNRGEATRIYDAIYQSSKDTGVAVTETAGSFGRYWIAMEKVGKSADETVDMVSGLQIAMANAGVSTSGMAAVSLQLGQALGKGKLNGDELTSIRENLPQLVEGIRKSLNLTDAAFQKLVEGKEGLSAEKIIGPLMDFAAAARKQMSLMPMTLSRATGVMKNVWQRFLADLDKEIGLSQRMANNVKSWALWLDTLRAYLPVVGSLIAELGGLESIMQRLYFIVGTAAGAFLVMNPALVTAGLAFAAIAAGIVLAAVALEDFYVWVKGGDSLLGRKFGSFDTLFAGITESIAPVLTTFASALPTLNEFLATTGREFQTLANVAILAVAFIRENWEPIKEFFSGIVTDLTARFATTRAEVAAVSAAFMSAVKYITDKWEPIKGFFVLVGTTLVLAFGSMQSGLNILRDALMEAPRTIQAAWAGIASFFENVWTSIATTFETNWQRLKRVIDEAKQGLTLPANPGPPSLNGMPIPLFNGGRPDPISYGTGLQGRMGGGGGAANMNISAPITNTISVTATGTNGAEIAAATQSGVTRALPDGEVFARALGVAVPRIEAAAA